MDSDRAQKTKLKKTGTLIQTQLQLCHAVEKIARKKIKIKKGLFRIMVFKTGFESLVSTAAHSLTSGGEEQCTGCSSLHRDTLNI